MIPDEDPAKFQELADEYYKRFQPEAPEERDLLDTLITAVWQLRRLRRVETMLWTKTMEEKTLFGDKYLTLSQAYGSRQETFQRLQSRLNAAERTFRRCLQDLKRLEAERLSAELPEPTPQPATSRDRFDPSRDATSRDRQGAVPRPPQPAQPKQESS